MFWFRFKNLGESKKYIAKFVLRIITKPVQYSDHDSDNIIAV